MTLVPVIPRPRPYRVFWLYQDACREEGEQLANHLGTAREVVSRIVRHLVARGVNRNGRGAIEIVDRAALEASLQD